MAVNYHIPLLLLLSVIPAKLVLDPNRGAGIYLSTIIESLFICGWFSNNQSSLINNQLPCQRQEQIFFTLFYVIGTLP